jgi:hypothetical protein
MAKKKLKKNKYGITAVRFDYESFVKLYCSKEGKNVNKGEFADITGCSRVMLAGWIVEMPQALAIINHFMKEFDMDFEDLVKEVYE